MGCSAVQQRNYDIIKTAVEIFNARTCLKWLPYTPELAKELGHDHFKSLQIPSMYSDVN